MVEPGDCAGAMPPVAAKDNEIKQLWDKYYAACLRYAQCKKIPANFCEGLPASW
jgi:hypothetical protein